MSNFQTVKIKWTWGEININIILENTYLVSVFTRVYKHKENIKIEGEKCSFPFTSKPTANTGKWMHCFFKSAHTSTYLCLQLAPHGRKNDLRSKTSTVKGTKARWHWWTNGCVTPVIGPQARSVLCRAGGQIIDLPILPSSHALPDLCLFLLCWL